MKFKRGPNLFFKYFYFLFGPGLFYPLRVIARVQTLVSTVRGENKPVQKGRKKYLKNKLGPLLTVYLRFSMRFQTFTSGGGLHTTFPTKNIEILHFVISYNSL